MILFDRQIPQLVALWSQRLIMLFYVTEYFADVIKFLITFHDNIHVIKIWSQDSKGRVFYSSLGDELQWLP